MILVMALFVMTITRPVQRLATILRHLDRARHDPGVDPAAILPASLPYRNEIGILAAAVTVFRDTLVNLHLMQRRLQGLQDNALDAIITIDALGRVIEFNPSAEKLFGYRKDDVQGRSISTLIIPPRFREAHQRGLAHQRASTASTCVGQRMEVPAPCGPTAASFWWN
ncbi:MAG: PAS domain-containing protein [Rhodospirillaceae bacterium]|nr:MAG: PAS domain-containing protein [Rhodospirillaceae bacterium]